MKQKVIIIGHGFSSRLSLIRAIGQMEGNYEIVVIVIVPNSVGQKKNIDCYSKYVDTIYYSVRNDSEALFRLLSEKCKSQGCKSIIIPDGDFEALAIDKYKSQLQTDFLFPYILGNENSVEYWMDKLNQKNLAKEIGLPVANSVVLNVSNGSFSIPSEIRYPCFCKPLNTVSGGKGGMCRCDNDEQLKNALTTMVKERPHLEKVLVEDFINIEKEYAVVGVSDGDNICIPALLEFLVGAAKMKGIAKLGKVSPLGDMQDVVSKFKELIKRIGFVGLFDIDFFESNGTIYFCELNLRYGGSGEAVSRMGVNLPAMYVEFLSNSQQVNPNVEITSSATYVNDRMCYQDWVTNQISYREMKTQLHSSDFRFIPFPGDKGPERAFNLSITKNRYYKVAFKVLKMLHLRK